MDIKISLNENKPSDKIIIDYLQNETYDNYSVIIKDILTKVSKGLLLDSKTVMALSGMNVMPVQQVQPVQNNYIPHETEEEKRIKEENKKLEEDREILGDLLGGMDF
ncbi:hypothetical protein [Paraclostridium bifermentans]|uniref:hypothetical protein n=1 Tax=Paraclostridium bifermentans TaxID=1490 RepID=UPI00241C8855|nr:hypothetical protein [Paraclostridium bifermentans]